MNLVRSALIGIVALLMFLGGLWMFQRETAIIRNQDALISAVSQHEKTIGEIVQFLNQAQRAQQPQKASTPNG